MRNLSKLVLEIPAASDLVPALKFIAVFAGIILIIRTISKMLLGPNSTLNRSLSASIGILCIYILTIAIYTFHPKDLSQFLAPLPFVTFDGDTLRVFSFQDNTFSEICAQILSMVLLAFLANFFDSLIPRGKRILTWYASRFVSVLLAMGLHCIAIRWINAFLPGTLAAYAPIILLSVLIIMFLIGLINGILSLILTVANPILGAIYAFFFSNTIGKQMSKAVFTTTILCGVVFALNHLGYMAIAISSAALLTYLLFILTLLLLLYIIDRIF